MSSSGSKKTPTGEADRLVHSPFGALGALTGIAPAPALPSSDNAPATKPAPLPVGTRHAVVRIERTGRGGKEVTIVEQLALPPVERERWLKALKASLGCGGALEGEAFVLQGDHRDRLPKILTARGVKTVTVAR